MAFFISDPHCLHRMDSYAGEKFLRSQEHIAAIGVEMAKLYWKENSFIFLRVSIALAIT